MSLKLRPPLAVPVDLPADLTMQRLQQVVQSRNEDFSGQFRSRHAMVSIHESKRHFWSPWLHLEYVDTEYDHGQLDGRFSPHPNIWTGVVFSYLAMAVLGFFAAVWGCSQWLIGQFPWALSGVGVCILLAIVVALISMIGQRLAAKEMSELELLVVQAVGRPNVDPSEVAGSCEPSADGGAVDFPAR